MKSDESEIKTGKKRKQTLIVKFVLILFIFLAICFSLLCVISANTVKNDAITTYEDFSSTITEKSAELISNWIEGLKKDMRVYTESDIFRKDNVDDMIDYIQSNLELLSESFSYVGVAGSDGQMHTSNGKITDINDRDYFQAIMKDNKFIYIDNPSVSRTNHMNVFHIALPVIDYDGDRTAMFCAVISIENLQDVTNSIKIGKKGYAYAISGDGTNIAHPNQDLIMQNHYKDSAEESGFEGLLEISSAMIEGKTGAGTIKNIKTHEKNRIFYHPIEGTSWSLAISIPFSQVYESAYKVGTFITFVSIGIAIVILMFSAVYLYLLLRPLNKVKNNISEIATGEADLTKRIITKSDDEIGEVVKGFNTFTEKLHNIISRIKNAKDNLQNVDNKMQESIQETGSSITQILSNIGSVTNQITNQSASVEETAGAVTEIAQNIESLNKMIETQASGVTQASAAVEEMIGNINSVTISMDHMADSFNTLETHTRNGVEKQNDVNQRITQIEDQSKMLFDANKAISQIASQTNLLAMNAAIEAAHAGEAGKGFSVVADEIRKLSETSTSQSKTIGSELKKIQASITSVVSASLEAQKSFNAVNTSIKETDELVQQIKGAMIESQEGSKQITDALKMMNDSTVEVRTASTEMSEGNKAILEEVRRLQEATMAMKDSIGEMSSGAKHINEQGATLADVSGTMEDSIVDIGKEIDLFKV